MMVLIALVLLLALLLVFVARQARLVLRRGIDMDTRRSSRVFATLVLGVVMGVVTLFGASSDRTKGREAYLQRQAERFDSFVAKPHSIVVAVFAGVFTTGMAIGAYELLAWGMALAIGSTKRNTTP